MVAIIVSVLSWTGAAAGVLVVSPHPDDDTIIASGVLNRAAGIENTKVVFMTNGDFWGGLSAGYTRQGEAVNAQTQHIGLTEDDLIFLGYPDGRLKTIYDNYTTPGSQYFTPFGQGVTYGNRGLGRTDFHSHHFGSPAAYNRPNIVTDLETILRTYRPGHIFTTAEFDQHEDHATTYQLLRLALDRVRATDPSYAPVLNKTLVWTSNSSTWPTPADPTAYHAQMPGLNQTPLRWDERASLDVPLPMQDLNLRVNPKYRAIQSHVSQTGPQSFISRFAHKDEVFWSENPFGSNQPPVAHAGNDIYAGPGQFVILNGSLSRDPEGSPLGFQWAQRSGSPVSLVDANTMYPGFSVPANATVNDAWTFELVVSDGTFTSARDTVTVYGGTPIPNIAPLATASASSQNSADGQLASKAIDRLVEGWPGDYTLEWATSGQGAGAWIRLTWSEPMLISRVVLFDRPNLSDRVMGGTLAFSDGTSVPVAALVNDATSGTEVTFAPRVVNHVTFTVTSVASGTANVGLAELQVFGQPAEVSDTTPPTTPGDLQVTGTTSSTVSLSWSASTDAGGSGLAGYRIYRNGGANPLASVTGTSFTDTGLAPESTHEYRVSAYDGAGNESALAGPVNATTAPGSGGGSSNIAPLASVMASSQNTSTGQLAIKAIDGIADGWPGDFTREWATVGQGAGAWITLSWPAAYRVDRVVLFDRPNADDQIIAGSLIFSDGSSVAVGTLDNSGAPVEIAFAARAITSLTLSITAVSGTTLNIGLAEIQVFGEPTSGGPSDTIPPTTPGNLQVTGTTTTSISLSWSASTDTGGSGLAGYRIYRDGSPTPLATVTGTTFTDTGLAPGSAHSYSVSAYDGAGNESAAAGPVNATAQDTQAPTVPQSLRSGTIGATSATILWNASTDAGGSGLAGYRVFRDGVLFAIVAAPSFTDTTLRPGTRYRYNVAAFDNAGNQSAQSSALQINTKKK